MEERYFMMGVIYITGFFGSNVLERFAAYGDSIGELVDKAVYNCRGITEDFRNFSSLKIYIRNTNSGKVHNFVLRKDQIW